MSHTTCAQQFGTAVFLSFGGVGEGVLVKRCLAHGRMSAFNDPHPAVAAPIFPHLPSKAVPLENDLTFLKFSGIVNSLAVQTSHGCKLSQHDIEGTKDWLWS